MNRPKRISLCILISGFLIFVLSLTDCSSPLPDDYARHNRVKQLMFDLSSSAADRHIVDSFHSAMTNRSNYISESHWNGTEFDESHRPFESDYSPTETDLGGGVFRLVTSFNNDYINPPGTWTGHAITLEMKEDGTGTWMITYLNGAGVVCGTPH